MTLFVGQAVPEPPARVVVVLSGDPLCCSRARRRAARVLVDGDPCLDLKCPIHHRGASILSAAESRAALDDDSRPAGLGAS